MWDALCSMRVMVAGEIHSFLGFCGRSAVRKGSVLAIASVMAAAFLSIVPSGLKPALIASVAGAA
eukprot:15444995-Alexandrium_andersonii.AAC.1